MYHCESNWKRSNREMGKNRIQLKDLYHLLKIGLCWNLEISQYIHYLNSVIKVSSENDLIPINE